MNRINLWVIFIFISILGVVFISGSGNQTTVTKGDENQLPNMHTGPVKMLPINSPVPTNNRSAIQSGVKKTQSSYTSKPSGRSVALATFIFLNSGNQKTQFVKKFADGKDDLPLAINNLALLFDRDPQSYTIALAAVLDYSIKQGSKNSGSTTLDDLEWKLIDIENQLDDLNSRLGR